MAEVVGVTEPRRNIGAHVRRAGEGERLLITRRGRPVAELRPLPTDQEASPKSLFHVSKHETMGDMLKGQDVVVLLKLLGVAEAVPVRDLASQLGFDVAGTHRAMHRLDEAGLYSAERRRVFQAPAEEFLVHAAKFSFPPRWRAEARGIPTSWAAEPLKDELAEPAGLPPVWPYSKGTVRGLALEPLHSMAPQAALADPELWQRLALVDALRSNDSARITQLAAKLLQERIGS